MNKKSWQQFLTDIKFDAESPYDDTKLQINTENNHDNNVAIACDFLESIFTGSSHQLKPFLKKQHNLLGCVS